MSRVSEFNLTSCLQSAREASRLLPGAERDKILRAVATALEAHCQEILAANQLDVQAERARGTKEALIDRLSLSEARVLAMAAAVRQVAALPDPLHRVYVGWQHPEGMQIRKVSVPFGVIGMIYESRPNVTVDAATLALKAGSAAVLRGSANALNSNRTLVKVMRSALASYGLKDALQLIDSSDRRYVTDLLRARGKVDLIIPRGGAALIQHVVENAQVPTIETGVGNCHIFVDASADLRAAEAIILNAKTQRPGVCNAVETLLIHQDVAAHFVPQICKVLGQQGVEIFACQRSRDYYPGLEPASEEDWVTEYLDLKLALKVVESLEVAVSHINTYGSQHSEAILTSDMQHARQFQEAVDAAAVFVNASTRFTDGFEFGFGAEIGISTQKLHARGPMGLNEIVTYKYIIDGTGQTRLP